jgi:hypothetical protein
VVLGELSLMTSAVTTRLAVARTYFCSTLEKLELGYLVGVRTDYAV